MRRVALFGLAAVGVHQFRYLAGYGHDSARALSEQGHGYLACALPELVGAAVLLIASSIAAAAIGRTSGAARQLRVLPEMALYSLILIAIFAAQEAVEQLASNGHPSGLAGVFGSHGWVALPLALAFGALVTLALRVLGGTDRILARQVVRARRGPRNRSVARPPARRGVVPRARLTLAFGFARRPPPSVLRFV